MARMSYLFSIALLLFTHALLHHRHTTFVAGHSAAPDGRPMIINRSEALRDPSSPTTFEGDDVDAADAAAAVGGLLHHRNRRAAPATTTSGSGTDAGSASSSNLQNASANITTKINYLNDSHAQLMVHWLGDGTNVMICLAREPPLGPLDDVPASAKPSAVYISYDYGDTFIDKTLLFTVPVDRKDMKGKQMNSTLDQFVTNPNYNTIVFTDPKNKAIFTNSDTGKTFKRYMLDFTPSEVIFYENDARTFLILDKVDVDRKLYYTTDFGETFDLLQWNVKSVMWSSGDEVPTHLYVERKEPTNTSSVIFMNALDLLVPNKKPKFNVIIENVLEFYMKKDFLCATRKVLNNTQLFISYKRGKFVRADFQTELDILGLHIADVEGTRLMVSAVHSEYTCHLYVSEADETMSEIKFVPSLENVFSYVPGLTWKTSWLDHTTDEPFTDIYKVEGLRGIYIASKVFRPVNDKTHFGSITPEHLGSLISFDHGASWKPIRAPTVDHEGQLINCSNCSLHLSQKFTQLYPVTRSVPIMSSKSAPGVIMATGVVGKSMKGHPCVYLSRDAGQTWKQILKNYHFFNYGDHGGVLVTVKFFKTKGETDEILYSIDEGEKWMSYRFHSTDLKMYGLMTEPNTNSTVFTLFGSEVSEHRWLIVKVDLKNAFEYNCTADDYKFWSPGSRTGDSIVPCVLGLQETYQRRAAHAKCYNGKSYDRPVRSEVCECGRWDFECDMGFSRLHVNAPCVRNKTLARYDPYAIPASCAPGEFYNRTKGYRRISGDVCVHGDSSQFLPQAMPCPFGQANDFLVVAQRDKISRIEIPSGKKEVMPVEGLKNVIAIEFDIRQNCVFWADILTDAIGRQCFNGNQSRETLLETDLASVEGMSYDWISELLYFVDGTRLKIEAITTSEQRYGRVGMRKTIIEKQHLLKPRGIVVHPLEGYLFWTDWSQTKPAITRSNLDGTDIRVLFTKPQIFWPNGITIDYIAERVYWVDASKDYIASCDLNGKSFRKILEQDSRVAHPFAVAVYKDHMYWDDWKMNSVFSADKDHGIMVRTLADHMPSLMDLKIYAHSIQTGSSACSATGGTHNCSHICVAGPHKTFSCLCPDSMELSASGECVCPGSHQPFANKTCPQLGNTCPPNFFACANQKCVASIYRCDGENDCRDNSDELDCPSAQCPALTFPCAADNKCIPEYFRCDHDKDCADGSDELQCNFTDCRDGEFKCNNGRCINQKWKCDGEDDCRDGSDESECGEQSSVTCKPGDFRCVGDGRCVSADWRCDSDVDCADGSDERNCTQSECDPWMFNCGNGRCVFKTWHCDGDADCDNGADEKNCTYEWLEKTKPAAVDVATPITACHDWMFKCTSGRCVPFWWKCDGVTDCSDGSDELGCPMSVDPTGMMPQNNSSSSSSSTPRPSTTSWLDCTAEQFRCDSGRCLPKSFVCDGDNDCQNGEDETNCSAACGERTFRCHSDGHCLPIAKYCDGTKNCVDGSDEEGCTPKASPKPTTSVECSQGMFACDDHACFPLSKRCDGRVECYDGTDEENCDGPQKRVFQVQSLHTYPRTINATSFLVYWYISVPDNRSASNGFEYLPSCSVLGSSVWRNHTEWIAKTEHRFVQLEPFTQYNVTVYVREQRSATATASTAVASPVVTPFVYVTVQTAEGYPSEPRNVTVTQLNGSRVQVSWLPPRVASGQLKEYTVYYNLQTIAVLPAKALKVSPLESSLVLESNFQGNETYAFWVKVRNSRHESPSSKLVRLTFDDVSNMDRLTGLQTTSIGADFIELSWTRIAGVDGYLVQPVLPQPYPAMASNTTTDPRIRLSNLTPGGQINIKVSAFIKSRFGRVASLSVVLEGAPLPEVPNQLIFNDGTEVGLRWSAPNPAIADIVYGIYYGTSLDDLFSKPRHTTTNTTFQLTDLQPCSSYLLGVGIVGPRGPGPLRHTPLQLSTDYRENSPPRNVRAILNEQLGTLLVTWENSCPLLSPAAHTPSYVVSIADTMQDRPQSATVVYRPDQPLQHTFASLHRGAVYNVSVTTKATDAQPVQLRVVGPELPAPRQLKVYPEKNGTYVVFWKSVAKNDETITYELVVVRGFEMKDTNQSLIVFSKQARDPPMLINPSDLGAKDVAGQVFTFGVRTKSTEGYHSAILEIEHIEVPQDAFLSALLPTTTSMWLVLVPLVLVVALAATVVYLWQRHRRLAMSFSRFANLHYDSRTGATRIGDALDEDEHNESTRCDDDDEPLVIP